MDKMLTVKNFLRWCKLNNKELKLIKENIRINKERINLLEKTQNLLINNFFNNSMEFRENYAEFYIG